MKGVSSAVSNKFRSSNFHYRELWCIRISKRIGRQLVLNVTFQYLISPNHRESGPSFPPTASIQREKNQIELLAPPITLVWVKHFWLCLKIDRIPELVIAYDSRVIPPTRGVIWSERIIRHLHSHELASFG